MTDFHENYARVTHDVPCPVCGRLADGCLIRRDGKTCICVRTPSPRRFGNAGWEHAIQGTADVPPPTAPTPHLDAVQVREYLQSLEFPRAMMERQAALLKLDVESLFAMYARYAGRQAAVAFPMFRCSELGRAYPSGVSFRRSDGKRWSLGGSQLGLFLSRSLDFRRPIWVTEGSTDAAALVGIGLPNVVGRPSCSTGADVLNSFLSAFPRTPYIVLADPDEVGRDGARRLLNTVKNPGLALVGPCDVREYVTTGLTKHTKCDILEGIDGDEHTDWRPLATNLAGACFDFAKSLMPLRGPECPS